MVIACEDCTAGLGIQNKSACTCMTERTVTNVEMQCIKVLLPIISLLTMLLYKGHSLVTLLTCNSKNLSPIWFKTRYNQRDQ